MSSLCIREIFLPDYEQGKITTEETTFQKSHCDWDCGKKYLSSRVLIWAYDTFMYVCFCPYYIIR